MVKLKINKFCTFTAKKLIFIFLLLLLLVCYQDFKERMVYEWVLYALIGIGALGYLQRTSWIVYGWNILINASVLLFIMGVLWGYSKWRMEIELAEGLGKGDVLFFVMMAVSFPNSSFLPLFVFSTLFSLLVFLVLKPSLTDSRVPLAGLQAGFLFIFLCVIFAFDIINVYAN